MPIRWKENAVVNVKLKDDLYTIAQMYQHPYMQFFKISNETGNWDGINLIDVPKYIFIPHDKFFGKEHYVEKLKNIEPIEIVPPKYAIKTFPRPSLVEPVFRKDGLYDSYNAKLIKDNLNPLEDEKLIRQYETVNLELNWNLKTRLIYFFETGEDISLSKLLRFYPDEFIHFLNIFNEKFEVLDSEGHLQKWKNYLENIKK